MISRFLTLIALVFFSTGVFAYSNVEIPELKGRSVFTGKVQPTAAQKEKLTSTLKDLDEVNKVQMAVLVVDSVKPLSIEEYSMKVAEKWEIGQKGVDNGVLLVVATSDRKARIEVGKGLEGVLTDAMSKRLQSEKMIPYFKKGEFAEGIVSVVSGIKAVTTKEIPVITHALEVKKSEADEEGETAFLVILSLVLIGVLGGIFIFWYLEKKREKELAASEARRAKAMEEYMRNRAKPSSPSPYYSTPRSTAISKTNRSTSSPNRSTSSSSSSSSNRKNTKSESNDNDGFSSTSSYGYTGSTRYSNDDDDDSSRKSSSTSSSNNDSSNISGGGSFSGGGASSEW